MNIKIPLISHSLISQSANLKRLFHSSVTYLLLESNNECFISAMHAPTGPHRRLITEKMSPVMVWLLYTCEHMHDVASTEQSLQTLMRFSAMHLGFQHHKRCAIDVIVQGFPLVSEGLSTVRGCQHFQTFIGDNWFSPYMSTINSITLLKE